MVRKNNVGKEIVPFTYPLSFFDVWGELEREMWDSWKPFPEMGLVPGTEMREEKGRLIVKTELHGIAKKDLDISLEDGRLTIKAETKHEGTGGKKKGFAERHYNRYFHSVTLPYAVKGDKATATFNKGVLELKLPKAEETGTRKIAVKAEVPRIEARKKEHKA